MLAVKLETLRVRTGKSRADVASDLDISERHVYRLEKGVTPLSRRWALVFASYYGVDVDEIADVEDGNGEAA